MEEYPEELRSPPVSLVALVGCSELHSLLSKHLNSQHPPINSLALPDLSKISPLLSPNPNPKFDCDSNSNSFPGILQRDWLQKHRTKIPSVVAALFPSNRASGDPAQWLQLCSDLDNLKAVIRPKNIRLVLVVVHSQSKDDITEDRMLALRKRAEVDSKYVVSFASYDDSELKLSLLRVANIFSELANSYYRDEGRKVKTRIEKKSVSSIELHIRYCFKVAVYAEFQRDWAEALRFYEEAYHTVREMIGTSTRSAAFQRLVELKVVAEQLHFKISTLLLHGGKIIDAVKWFRQHNASYRKVRGAHEAIFLHWEWMSRQFLVFAELLETSSKTYPNISSLAVVERPLTEWELYPAYYYQYAAHYLKEKRSSLEFAVEMSETLNEIDSCNESVVPSIYVGQFARLIERENELVLQPLSDDDYIRYVVSEGKKFQASFEIITLLKKSCESYSNLKAHRMSSFCGFHLAREYYGVDDFNNAKPLFEAVSTLYRQEAWVSLLWEALGYLRECSRKQGVLKDFMEYSLQIAALPVSIDDTGTQSLRFKECGPAGPASSTQRELIHKEVFGLIGGEVGLSSTDGNSDLKITVDNPIRLEIDLVSPHRLVLLASVAFHEQTVQPGSPTLMTLSLLTQLPVTIEIDRLEIQFNQSHCNFIILNSQRHPSSTLSDDKQDRRVEKAPSLALSTNRWLRLTYDVKSDQSGKLECIYVVAKMGPHFTICCRAESPAAMDDFPLWKYEDRMETCPTKDPDLAFSGQKAIQVEEPGPEVDLHLGASSPAFVGESFMVPVTVISKGHEVHSGELKINIVDVKGGDLFSPRESESFFTDSHHVQILGISGLEEEDDSQLGTEKIKKIQESFGLVSVPFLKCGDSWSCKVEIKWHKPKAIMLYVSLGYCPDSNETAQKVNIQKSFQIEGKTAIVIDHRFMLPFRQDPLLLSTIKADSNSDPTASLPLNEASILIISAKNCTNIPLQLLSISIEGDDGDIGKLDSLQHGSDDHLGAAPLVPGEEFKKAFSVTTTTNATKLNLGNLCLRWRRNSGMEEESGSTEPSVLTKHKLPDVNLDLSPLVVSLECPPYAILGDPLTYFIKIRNQTKLLQEVKVSLQDAQSFVTSGSHNDSIFVLPKYEYIISYKLVPLVSGMQQLPRFTLTSVRYSAGFQPSIAASTLFVFPSKPNFKMVDVVDNKYSHNSMNESSCVT